MDPNANLEEMNELAEAVLNDDEMAVARWGSKEEQLNRLAELVVAMDDWIVGGGFIPDKWRF